MKRGKVYLVGAGPGDPGLITVKGLECLSTADTVIYDHLLDESLINNARKDSEKIYVGKSGSHHTLEQNEINKLIVTRAKEGKIVVRLKGGDPFLFGRGGEEAEILASEGIPFEIVPGVTSAIAVPSYAGIPVTHRALSSSVAIVTGHEDPAKKSVNIAWDKLAWGTDTLILLMAMQNLPDIVEKLIGYGRKPETPVAIIQEGTRPQQITVIGTLHNIVEKVKECKIEPPAIVVVGSVVTLRDKLRWFDNGPLWGKRILITRARSQSGTLSKLLREKGAQTVELPAIKIQPSNAINEMNSALLKLSEFQWIIFTSVNSVESFFSRLNILNLDSRALHGVNVASIGPATSESLKKFGIRVDYQPTIYTSTALAEGLKNLNIHNSNILLPRSDIADEDLCKNLESSGARVHRINAYLTKPDTRSLEKALDLIHEGKIDVVTFTSSSTVNFFIASMPANFNLPQQLIIACIGPKTAESVIKAGLKVDIIARQQTIPGLVEAIEEFFTHGGIK